MVKKLLLIFILAVFCISMLGCQTVQGIGGDIQWTGQKGEELMQGK